VSAQNHHSSRGRPNAFELEKKLLFSAEYSCFSRKEVRRKTRFSKKAWFPLRAYSIKFGMEVRRNKMAQFKTSEIAKISGIHPNTVRLYEQWGFLPPVPREKNGYRTFSDVHVLQLKIIRTAFKSTWLGGKIRQQALSVIKFSAETDYTQAYKSAWLHLDLISAERLRAEEAVALLERWASEEQEHNRNETAPEQLTIGQAAVRLDVTIDMLRGWERNGLIRIPRDLSSGYRIFDSCTMGRVRIIRTLRQARYSIMSIMRMFKNFDSGKKSSLTDDLNWVPPEDDIFYSTDRWLHKIREIEQYSAEIIELLDSRRLISYQPAGSFDHKSFACK
jgi:DNA-binding transcriptional MerR regulator